MINGEDVYDVLSAIVPLYVSMALAYCSFRWWRIFSQDQCSGINRFVSVFAVPLLSFKFISENDPYSMNYRFILADFLQKIVVFAALFIGHIYLRKQSFDWTITNFSVATLPNTLVVGIPLLTAMYGDVSRSLMIQIIVLQGVVWYTLLLFLYEYRASKILISEQFTEEAATSIVAIRAESDVISLARADSIRSEAEVDDSGGIHVVLRSEEVGDSSRLSNMTGVEIYSVQSFDLKGSSFRSRGAVEIESDHSVSSRADVETNTGVGDDTGGKREGDKLSVASGDGHENRRKASPAAGVMFKLILVLVWRKVVRNPNTYGSILGLVWSIVFFKAGWDTPDIVRGSVSILANAGLGMAMFSLAYNSDIYEGLFMATQPKILACGPKKTVWSMLLRFLLGPMVMCGASLIVGLRGNLLSIAIVQSALPQGIVPFVFAQEYNVHPHVLNTSVVFGIIVALPVTIIYYSLLAL